MLAAQARLEPGQKNILILWQVLWDQTTCDEYPRFILHREETIVVTPAAPWESHPAMAHRKEKVRFLQIQDFLLGPSPLSCAATHLAPLLHTGIRKQRGNEAQAAIHPVPTLGLVRGCHVLPSERGAPAPAPLPPLPARHQPAKLPAGAGSPGTEQAWPSRLSSVGNF